MDVHQGREVEDRSVEAGTGLLAVVRIGGDSFDYDVDLLVLVP